MNKKNNKIYINLEDKHRELLSNLSSIAKQSEILEGFERKALYNAGKFPEWFPGMIEKIISILEKFLHENTDLQGKHVILRGNLAIYT